MLKTSPVTTVKATKAATTKNASHEVVAPAAHVSQFGNNGVHAPNGARRMNLSIEVESIWHVLNQPHVRDRVERRLGFLELDGNVARRAIGRSARSPTFGEGGWRQAQTGDAQPVEGADDFLPLQPSSR